MTFVPAAMPDLLVVGASASGIGNKIPVVCFNPAENRIEGHYFTIGITGTFYNMPQGNAINLAPNVIGTVYTNSGPAATVKVNIRLFHIDTALSEGAAYSAGASGESTAITHTHYATTGDLIGSNWGTGSGVGWYNLFILPYTLTHFLVVSPQYVFRVSIADGSVSNQFAIDTGNATYSRFAAFGTAPAVPPPVVMADGTIVLYALTAIRASDSATITVNALARIDPLTGTTQYTNYGGVTGGVAGITPNPDGTFYTQVNGDPPATRKISANLSTVTTITGFDQGAYNFVTPAAQDDWWWWGGDPSTGPYYPVHATVSGSTGTDSMLSASGASGPQSTLFTGVNNYPVISVFSSTELFVRTATGSGTGTSIGSYVGVYNMSDGSVATGYTKQQMVDSYGAMSISGSGFDNSTFSRPDHRCYPDPTLYTVREVLQLMGTDVTPITAKVYNGTTWDTATVKVYNGTTWDTATPKVYNGSAWDG